MGGIFKNPTLPKKAAATKRQLRYFSEKKDVTRAPNIQHEEKVQKMVCHYLKLKLPSVIFRSDTSSGRWEYNKKKLHEKVAMHSSKDFPDLFIYEPRDVTHSDGSTKHYCGLAMELKKEGTTVILKIGERKGKLSTDPHIQAQAAMLKKLIEKGYYANFAVGYDEAINMIDWYFGLPRNTKLF